MKENQPESEGTTLEGFWNMLMFRLSGGLSNSDIPELNGFWCDGIYLPSSDHQLKKKFINDNRKIHLNAWLGKNGQEIYTATIYFGRKAQSLYARDLPLKNSIPEEEFKGDWFTIDQNRKTIEIKLK